MAFKFHRDDATFNQVNFSDLTGTIASVNSTVWSTYTPTIIAGAGSFTTTSAVGRWQAIGKTTFLNVVLTITDSGTAATSITATLPATSTGRQMLVGKETAVHGRMLVGDVQSASSNMVITDFNNSFPVSTGAVLNITGIYERA